MPSMSWFRMHAEARTDRKLLALTDAEHRVWFQLLCYASEQAERGCVVIDDWELLAIELGIDEDVLRAAVARLVKLRMVTLEDDVLCFSHFAERQYEKPSDEPARVRERVRRYREAQRQHETPCNADETRQNAPETDTETELETDGPPLSPPQGEPVGDVLLLEAPVVDPWVLAVVAVNAARGEYSPAFEAAWAVYHPKIGSKAEAWADWRKLAKLAPTIRPSPDAVVVAVGNYITHMDLIGQERRKHLCRFFSTGLWKEYCDGDAFEQRIQEWQAANPGRVSGIRGGAGGQSRIEKRLTLVGGAAIADDDHAITVVPRDPFAGQSEQSAGGGDG